MTTLERSPQSDLPLMELPELTLSRAGFHVRTLARQESKRGLAREPEAVSGLKSSGFLASYDPASSSWRTSQTCLLARLNDQADGLAEFSETWPSAGMMRNGKTYRRQPWALPILESASGLLPTPLKSDMQAKFTVATCKKVVASGKSVCHPVYWMLFAGMSAPQVATTYETMMGFPESWTDLAPVETP